jgi:Na+-driven multidrug efflux pump
MTLLARVILNGWVYCSPSQEQPEAFRNDTISSSNLERLGILFTKPRATWNRRDKDKDDGIPFISLPNGRSTLELMQLAGPIFFVIIGKVICYASLTLKATSFGVLQVATHNVMMRIFFFHATFGDSLTQAAQTYLPSTLLQKSNSQVKVLLKKLTILGMGIGIFSYISTKCVLQMGHLFTSNTRIIASMAQHTTSISWATLLHGYIMILEGVLIATGDLKYLVATYAMTMGVLFAQLKYATPHFGGVWIALLLFQVLRLAQFKSRVVHKVLLRGVSGGREEFVETQAVEQ